MSVTIHHGDNRDVLRSLPDNSIDSVVTDPPYALVSIQKRFGKPGAAPAKMDVYARASAGFMGKQWDTGETAFAVEFWAEVMRVLKPGGHVVAFSGTRTYHRMAVAIEDAGFEIRDQLGWLYGSGFPKSHDVAKGIDKALGYERAKVRRPVPKVGSMGVALGGDKVGNSRPWIDKAREAGFHEAASPEAASPEAAAWQGYGTALKPAWEPICVARKPLDGTVAENVLRWGVGALNIDGCRVGWPDGVAPQIGTPGWGGPAKKLTAVPGQEGGTVERTGPSDQGRWPANVLHDGSDEVVGAFPDSAPGSGSRPVGATAKAFANVRCGPVSVGGFGAHGDAGVGSAARFFYTAEPDDLCGLCGCPSGVFSGKLSPCNANTAEPSSPTENTQIVATAPFDAAGSQPPVREVKNLASSGLATGAEPPSSRHRQADSDTAAGPAATPGLSSLAQNVKSAGSLCDSCATAIAQSLAATQRGQSPASLPCPASIDGRSWQILTSSLALHVEGRESTDTTTTIPSLKLLLGSVFHAIGDTTRPAKSAALGNTESGPKRFHYSSKADATDRLGSKHPTVKPTDLMRWLVRLVTPPGGIVLDPFAGSGSTGVACVAEGFDAILIEREAEYVADIHRRIAWVKGEGRLTAQETARKQEGVEALPLFGGAA